MSTSAASPNLDLLRAVAVLLVLVDHVAMTFGVAQRHPSLLALGGCGVLLFFVHTSLVLMMSLERLKLNGADLFRAFYIRRFFRIYPLSTVTILIVVLFSIPETSWMTFERPSTHEVVLNLLLTGNLTQTRALSGPLWSLPYELQMYVLLPLLFLIVRRNWSSKMRWSLWLAAVAGGLLQVIMLVYKTGGAQRGSLLEFGPCFLAGVFAYCRSRDIGRKRLPPWLWPVSLSIFLIAYANIWYTDAHITGNTILRNRIADWSICLLAALLVSSCAESGWLALNRISHLIAKYSYGLYLGQVPVLWLVFIRFHAAPAWAKWMSFIILIVFVPVVSFHIVEEPFIRIGARLSARFRERRTATSLLPSVSPAGDGSDLTRIAS
jgi:peptidoglycan/LPS O-acetylase OafA/YrhL